jgi:hypothetical protein
LRDSFADQYPHLPIFAISGRRATDGTLREIKHHIWEPDSQPFRLPDLLGRIQASLESNPAADSDDSGSSTFLSSKNVA